VEQQGWPDQGLEETYNTFCEGGGVLDIEDEGSDEA